jgi:hypothetical protein
MTAGAELVPVAGVADAVAAVTQQVAEAELRANALQVSSDAEANAAGTILREIQQRRKAAEGKRKDLTGPLLESKRRIDQEFKDAMAPFDAADKIVREKLGTYTAEQERIRQEEEARLEAERQERELKAREERERQEAAERAKREQAEKEMREAEEEARAAKDAADAEVAAKLAEEARQKADEAKTAEAAIASLPEPALPKAVVLAAPKIDGVSDTKRWEPEVVDLAAVPTHLPDGEPLIEVRSGPLRRYMHAYIKEHGHPPEMAGVKFKQVDGLAVRA